MEFKCLESQLLPIKLIIAAADKHMPDVECSIWTIKEGTRTLLHDMPFSSYHQQLVAGCVQSVVKTLNNTPKRGGLSDILSPSTLVTGRPPPDFKTLTKLSFGEYVELKETSGFKNSMKQRTVGALAMYPSGNAQCTRLFWSLETGRAVHRKQWEKLPITNKIIKRVNQLGSENGQKPIRGNFRYTRGLSMSSDTKSDSDETFENRSHVNDSNSRSDGSDASVNRSTEGISDDEYDYSDNEEVKNGTVDLNNGQESHESVESDDKSPKRYKYIGTSDRTLRPRKKHIDYSMHQKYTDTQLL